MVEMKVVQMSTLMNFKLSLLTGILLISMFGALDSRSIAMGITGTSYLERPRPPHPRSQ